MEHMRGYGPLGRLLPLALQAAGDIEDGSAALLRKWAVRTRRRTQQDATGAAWLDKILLSR